VIIDDARAAYAAKKIFSERSIVRPSWGGN
jgi:hypothetical protein